MIEISTKHLDLIPSPDELRNICKSISVLEAIISPEWEYRYYSYQKDWSDNEEVFEMRDGSGDQMLILFNGLGACINGYAHEYEVANSLFELPEIFDGFIRGEPVKSIGTTFCIWQLKKDGLWKLGRKNSGVNRIQDGSTRLLSLLDGNPSSYKKWAEGYYEDIFEIRELDIETIKMIYQGAVLTKEMVAKINPMLSSFKALKSDLDEIGYKYDL